MDNSLYILLQPPSIEFITETVILEQQNPLLHTI